MHMFSPCVLDQLNSLNARRVLVHQLLYRLERLRRLWLWLGRLGQFLCLLVLLRLLLLLLA
jgi:hypothetical protein